jgi:hypothetical protein
MFSHKAYTIISKTGRILAVLPPKQFYEKEVAG